VLPASGVEDARPMEGRGQYGSSAEEDRRTQLREEGARGSQEDDSI
jgi:hypothetical protein